MAADAPAACGHFWDIAPAAGHESPGTCRKCGEIRNFLNSCDQVLAQAAVMRPLDFRAPRKREGVPVAKFSVHKRHKEIENRWPEIQKAIEETGSVNKAAEQLGYSYSSIRSAAGRHEFDLTPYLPKKGKGSAPARTSPRDHTRAPAGAASPTGLGDVLIGMGQVMTSLGAWLKERGQ